MPLQETLRHPKAGLAQSLMGVTALFPQSWYTQSFLCALQVSQYEKAKEPRIIILTKRRKKKQIPWPGQALLSQHFWRTLNVSQVFQLILMFQGGLGSLV